MSHISCFLLYYINQIILPCHSTIIIGKKFVKKFEIKLSSPSNSFCNFSLFDYSVVIGNILFEIRLCKTSFMFIDYLV